MKKTFHTGRAALGALLEVSLALVPALLFFYTYIHHYPSATFWGRGNLLFFVVYFAILVLFMTIYGSFSIRKYRTRELVFAFGLSCFFTDVITYFIRCMIAQTILSPKFVILTLLAQCLIETGLFIFARIMADRLEPAAPALLIVPEKDAEEGVRDKFDRRRTRYYIDRVVSADTPWDELCAIMHSYGTVVLLPMEKELRRRIMDDCFWHGVEILLKPDMQDIMVNCADTVIMSDVPLYAVHTGNHDRGYLTAKRGLDIVASVCGLLICSPIFLAAAVAIKIQDGGPVFYRQKRLTLGGKPFYLTKFRSMVVNAESELPQLLNILNGDMTLVGPRPERPEFYEKYCAEYPEFAYRLRAKAGLTGYAQLYGRYNTTFADKALLDMHYIQKASFLWDLQLIFYTLKIIFVKESTEGVETKPAEPEKKEPACAGESK